MTSALDITRSVKPPRAVFVNFPLGHQTGQPDQPELQRRIVHRRAAAFESITPPGAIVELPYVWDETIDRGKISTTPGDGCPRARPAKLPTPTKPSVRQIPPQLGSHFALSHFSISREYLHPSSGARDVRGRNESDVTGTADARTRNGDHARVAGILVLVIMVGRARGTYGVKAPATTGHPEFERYFRVHQNTLESAYRFHPGAVAISR